MISVAFALGGLFVLVGIRVILLAHQQTHEIGVLLDGAGFAQIGKARATLGFAGAALGVTVELGEDDDGDVQFFREPFEAGGNFRDFELAVVLRTAAGAAEELEVVDEDGLDAMLALEPAGLGAEFEDRKAGRVVDEKFALRELRRRRAE